MYYQAQSSQSNTPSSSPLPSPTSLNANANATATLNTFPSFNFRTTTAATANFLHPLSPHTPTTSQTPSTTPFSSPLSSPLHLFSLPRSQINANFTFPRPPPLLQPPSSLLAKRYHNAITPLNCINSVSTAPFSPISRDSYTSFLTLPYSSPTASTATYQNTNYSSYSLNPSPSSYPQETSSPSFLSSSPSFLSNPVYSQELHSNQIPQMNPFASCSLLEDVLEEAEALAGGDRPTKRRQITPSPPYDNNNNNDNFFSVSFGQYDTSSKTKEEECLQVNTMQEDIAKLLDWGSDSGEISNGQSSGITDDNLVLDVLQFTSLYPDASNAVVNDEHNNNCSWDDLYEIS